MTNANLTSFIQDNGLSNEHLNQVEIQELFQLVTEIKEQGFYYSSDLSGYISKNKLGNKYPHISGIVTMESQGTSWKFKGGFPSKIYRLVCIILNLRSNGSKARVTGFKPYASLGY